MDTHQEPKIAWLAWLLLDEVQNLLWNRYEQEFLHLIAREQEQNHLRFILDQESSNG